MRRVFLIVLLLTGLSAHWPQGPVEAPVEAPTLRPERLRQPVANRPGWFVEEQEDGSWALVGPDGSRQVLVGPPADEPPPSPSVPFREPEKPGRLVVLPRGVVWLPQEARITWKDDQRVVVHEEDGSSTVYHAAGGVVRRAVREGRP